MTSGSLWPPAAKNLMPLSAAGLCDAEHHTKVGVNIAHKKSGRGGRQDSSIENIDARTCQTRRNGRCQKFARDTRIASDDGPGTTTLGTNLVGMPPLCQHMGGSLSEAQCQICREFAIREPTNAIGPEKSSHSREAD